MVVPNQGDNNLVYDKKLSSVVPAKVTVDNKNHELTSIDVAMKLHYIKALYFFNNNNSHTRNNNTTTTLIDNIDHLKQSMFDWLVPNFVTCGRISPASETGGRPAIKLNDAGVRIVEAKSDKTIEEWLSMDGFVGLGLDHLVYGDPIGNNGLGLSFTPLVFIQITWFKCGGISMGLHWAHVLGDLYSASTFMNMFGHYLQGHHYQIQIANPQKPNCTPLSRPNHDPLSLKRVDPVGELWTIPTNCKMVTHSFHFTTTQLNQLLSKVHGSQEDVKKWKSEQYFEVISAIFWKSIARVRKYLDSNLVTICKSKSNTREKTISHYNNGQILGTIKVDSISKIDLLELISLVKKNMIDETKEVEEMVDNDKNDNGDFVVYGSNLTFVDMETSNIYDFNIYGQSPNIAVYTINGVGEKGVVLVHPCTKKENEDNVIDGKLVVVVVPHYEIEELKIVLKEHWSII